MARLDRTGARRVTMQDVANLAQCSQSTVSVVLNPGSSVRISQDTRERILKAAKDLGYKVERPVTPRNGPLRNVAVVFDDLTVCTEAVITVDGVRESLWGTGDIVSTYNWHADPAMEERTLAAILRSNVSAVIYSTVRTRQVVVPKSLYETDIPVVLLNCYSKDRAFPSVVPGDVAGGHRATERLVAAGHTRIAHITGEAWQEVSADRARGYRDALATADIPFDPALVREGNWQLSSGYEATLSLMQLKRPPTAIFCGNDRMAIGCYEALKQLGLRIPEDVSVVGFDDDEIASHLMPKLTTLKYPRLQMGIWAAERAMAPNHDRSETHRVVKIECELVERQSVAIRDNARGRLVRAG
ncbi:MAG: LacI family DNA-binding transcriptional regulator [Devosia sp.]|nr:LacI family DNA-binding transcriptional regulator [Devosia sp.]